MRRFFDTNVLVYAYDRDESLKREVARTFIAQAIAEDEFIGGTLGTSSGSGATTIPYRKPPISWRAGSPCSKATRSTSGTR
jgi:hypothetical protein